MGSCIADVIPIWQKPRLYAVFLMKVLSSDEDKNYIRLELIWILLSVFAFAEAIIIDRQKKSRINRINICNFID